MKDGAIEENWREIAIEKINQIIPTSGGCMACGKPGTVFIEEKLVTPVVMEPSGTMSIGGPSYPQVMLSCTHCGNVRYFNYVLLTAEDQQLDLENPND